MSGYLTPLVQLQRFFLPTLLALLAWAFWRTMFQKDRAVGLALYLALVIIVDGYLNTGIYLPGIEKGSIYYSEFCAFFLFINRPSTPNQHPSSRTVSYWAAIYFVLLFLSTLRCDPILAGIFSFRRLIVPQVVAFLVALRGLDSSDDYRRFFLCLTALVVVIGLFIFWDIFFDRTLLKSEMLSKPMYWMNRKHGRFGSFFLNPNYLGAFVVLVFPPAFVWTINERQWWPRLLAWTGLLILVFCLLETKSRAPLLAFGVALLMLILGPCGSLPRKRRLGLMMLFITAFTLLMPGFYRKANERFGSLDQETTREERSRESVWIYTVRIIMDNPVRGIGFGEQQFIDAMIEYGFEDQYGVAPLDNPHNSYLQMAVYAGIPALTLFLLANAALLLKSARIVLRDKIGPNVSIIFGLSVGITGFLFCIFPDMHLFTQTVAPVYWVFFGLLLAMTRQATGTT